MKRDFSLITICGCLSLSPILADASVHNWAGGYLGIDFLKNSGYINQTNQLSKIMPEFYEEIPIIGRIGDAPEYAADQVKVGNGYGLNFGYRHQYENHIVAGIQLGIQKYKSSKSHGTTRYGSSTEPYVHQIRISGGSTKYKFNASLSGQLGYSLYNDRILPYLTAGVAIMKLENTVAKNAQSCTRGEQQIYFSCENLYNYDWGRNRLDSKNITLLGYTYGIGVSFAFNKNIILNAEYSRNIFNHDLDNESQIKKLKFTTMKVGLSYQF